MKAVRIRELGTIYVEMRKRKDQERDNRDSDCRCAKQMALRSCDHTTSQLGALWICDTLNFPEPRTMEYLGIYIINVWHGVPLAFSWMSLDIRDDIEQRDRWECVLSGFMQEGNGRRAMSSMLWP
ncbi:hypothetical protein G5I_12993 [Acromyrmex echinatior]|uniref:Uncharacterized protein n=1 Tax=Acromyrmex echinatior TaxID=103372 RepID=F4X3T0_ACREC|nr:hypothetical protein G5I_12993 [Acromyrmex echinatior]